MRLTFLPFWAGKEDEDKLIRLCLGSHHGPLPASRFIVCDAGGSQARFRSPS